MSSFRLVLGTILGIMFLCDNVDVGCLCVYLLCYCYEMFYVLCHKRPRVLQVIKVTALIVLP